MNTIVSAIPVLIALSTTSLSGTPVTLKGNLFFSTEYLLNDICFAENARDIEKIIKHILAEYTDAGFPFCRVYPEIMSYDSIADTVILTIEEQERIIITDYLFTIDGKTMPAAARRVAQPVIGEYFSSTAVSRTIRNFQKIDVFSTIAEHIIDRNDTYYLLFYLQDRRSDALTAFGSFADELYDFSINFTSYNLLGTLRRLYFRYENQKIFSLKFAEPVLFFPVEIGGDFAITTYDSVRLVTVNGTITAPLGDHMSISLQSGMETFSYFGDDSLTANYSHNTVGVGLDIRANIHRFTLHQMLHCEYLFRDNGRVRLRYDGQFNLQHLVTSLHYYRVYTDSMEYFDAFRIGGARSLRGFREEEFIVPRALWFQAQYKKYFVFPLFDIGLIGGDMKYSYGVGIEGHTDTVGAMLVIAWPAHGSWRDGKIHVMLETGF
jgi:outer membrane protein assembly factor BamA